MCSILQYNPYCHNSCYNIFGNMHACKYMVGIGIEMKLTCISLNIWKLICQFVKKNKNRIFQQSALYCMPIYKCWKHLKPFKRESFFQLWKIMVGVFRLDLLVLQISNTHFWLNYLVILGHNAWVTHLFFMMIYVTFLFGPLFSICLSL